MVTVALAVVRHGRAEYVFGDVHTNKLEGYFSNFKHSTKAIYQRCDKRQFHRYHAEFDFRYNERAVLGGRVEGRAARLIAGIVGKRLMYRDSLSRASPRVSQQ